MAKSWKWNYRASAPPPRLSIGDIVWINDWDAWPNPQRLPYQVTYISKSRITIHAKQLATDVTYRVRWRSGNIFRRMSIIEK